MPWSWTIFWSVLGALIAIEVIKNRVYSSDIGAIGQYLYEMKQSLYSIERGISHLPTTSELRAGLGLNPEYPMQTDTRFDGENLESFHQQLTAIATTLHSIDDRLSSLIEVSEGVERGTLVIAKNLHPEEPEERIPRQ